MFQQTDWCRRSAEVSVGLSSILEFVAILDETGVESSRVEYTEVTLLLSLSQFVSITLEINHVPVVPWKAATGHTVVYSSMVPSLPFLYTNIYPIEPAKKQNLKLGSMSI